MTKYSNDSALFLEQFLEIFPNFISHLFRLYDVCRIWNIAALYFFLFFYFCKEQKYHCESFVSGSTRGFCVMHRQHGVGVGRVERREGREGDAAGPKSVLSRARRAICGGPFVSPLTKANNLVWHVCLSPDKKRYVSRRVYGEVFPATRDREILDVVRYRLFTGRGIPTIAVRKNCSYFNRLSILNSVKKVWRSLRLSLNCRFTDSDSRNVLATL